MRRSGLHLTAAEAARELGVSAKALRLYEQNGLLTPRRTAAGWRIYGPSELARAGEIAALRRLGMGLSQIKEVLAGGERSLYRALATHQAGLERQLDQIAGTVQSVESARNSREIATGEAAISLTLPWPWGGERFELLAVKAITYITGPLGSGKTRLARAIAEALPDAAFIEMERQPDDGPCSDPAVKAHLDRLAREGANPSPALTALILAMETTPAKTLVVDMVEQGLDQATQQALRRYLKSRPFGDRPLFLLTRSSSLLHLTDISVDEAILYCPANHDVPMLVTPRRGARGYEAVATCLATPAVRSRTEGVIACRPGAA